MAIRLPRFVAAPAAILLVVVLGYGLNQLSKSRTFQFFGGLVARVETGEKVVALTFDDAPSPETTAVLQILAERQAPATFFAIGRNLERYPGLAREIVAAGHQLGNHTYSHERMIFQTAGFVGREIEKTDALIAAAGYGGPIYFRPPNGKKLLVLPWYLNRHDITTIMWDVEPDTYTPAGGVGTRADFLVRYTLAHVRPGSIILMHPLCGEACEADRAALPAIVDGLQAQGYRFVTVSELLSR